jgi:hypothetical protein
VIQTVLYSRQQTPLKASRGSGPKKE